MISEHGTMHWEDSQISFAFQYKIFLAIFNLFFRQWDGSYYTKTLNLWSSCLIYQITILCLRLSDIFVRVLRTRNALPSLTDN